MISSLEFFLELLELPIPRADYFPGTALRPNGTPSLLRLGADVGKG